jgi:dTDP-4-dehydrorhamnose 3,5-epimerase
MDLTPLGIDGVWLAETPVWNDDRGYFYEWFKHSEILSKTGIDFSVKQANISKSHQGVVRGIHYSLAPEGQAKWVTCLSGSIQDVVVDLREFSPTFGESISVFLNSGDGQAILLSDGIGHGFLSLAHNSKISYLLNSEYSPKYETGIYPLDSELNIKWSFEGISPIISEKDLNAVSLDDAKRLGHLPRRIVL